MILFPQIQRLPAMGAFLISSFFCVLLVSFAMILWPVRLWASFPRLKAARLKHRGRYYALSQSLIITIADQQLVIGIAMLVAGIQHHYEEDSTFNHRYLVIQLAAQCNIGFVGALELEGRPLEEEGHGPGSNSTQYSTRLNWARIALSTPHYTRDDILVRCNSFQLHLLGRYR
ncbi:hypothetical protein BZA05DRAFT_32000 [Tricharina praecox]|uniref:uncharacterized protein n=1 Tax=Tricharina praecox TaxID=43433 RepID=UPI00221FE41B|nr:uncharacterized protein BZA05DRAFT_32000 [Tricharina praecox]KAI5853519.1 hypothetical protein BZA05DRAFT_32000 [Tricharina praecox]